MPDFNVRADSINVEQIMEQIRGRIREKRGVDYTEQQIQDMAAVKLEKFLDPRGVRGSVESGTPLAAAAFGREDAIDSLVAGDVRASLRGEQRHVGAGLLEVDAGLGEGVRELLLDVGLHGNELHWVVRV